MSPFSIIGGGGGRIRAQKWYLRYTVSPPPPPPRTLHWPFVTETAFSTNLLPEQQTRSKAHFNFCSSRSTVLLRNSKIVLRKAKWDAGARKVLNNPQSGFHAIFYFTVELPYFLFGLVCSFIKKYFIFHMSEIIQHFSFSVRLYANWK